MGVAKGVIIVTCPRVAFGINWYSAYQKVGINWYKLVQCIPKSTPRAINAINGKLMGHTYNTELKALILPIITSFIGKLMSN